MGIKTRIEYCDSTANLTSGCDGCELWVPGKGGQCYAGGMHERFRPRNGQRGNPAYPGPFEQVDPQPGRMIKAVAWSDLTGTERPDKPWLNGMPRVIFLSDMSDALSRDVPYDYLVNELIAHVASAAGRRHRFMWFTKRARRMAAFSRLLQRDGIEWPDNLMAVTSVTSPKTVRRLRWLTEVRCAMRGISFEPMLAAIRHGDIKRGLPSAWADIDFGMMSEFDWATLGGSSGRFAKPMHPGWALELRELCLSLGIPFFFKQWGDWLPGGQAGDRFSDEELTGFNVREIAHRLDDGRIWESRCYRVGKKQAGRQFDGRTWDGMPKAWRVESFAGLSTTGV